MAHTYITFLLGVCFGGMLTVSVLGIVSTIFDKIEKMGE